MAQPWRGAIAWLVLRLLYGRRIRPEHGAVLLLLEATPEMTVIPAKGYPATLPPSECVRASLRIRPASPRQDIQRLRRGL